MGSFLRANLPKAIVTIELPSALPPGCAYDLRITSRAQDDRVVRVVRDGLEIMAIHPDGRVEAHPSVLTLCDEITEEL